MNPFSSIPAFTRLIKTMDRWYRAYYPSSCAFDRPPDSFTEHLTAPRYQLQPPDRQPDSFTEPLRLSHGTDCNHQTDNQTASPNLSDCTTEPTEQPQPTRVNGDPCTLNQLFEADIIFSRITGSIFSILTM